MSDVLWRDENLDLGYHGRPVLRGLEAKFRRGDRYVLVGPNGAGKSTFLKAAFEPGLILRGRREIPIARTRIAYLAQNPRLAHSVPATVRDFLLSSLALTRGQRALGPAELSRIDELLGRVGLADRAGDLTTGLSGGQVQRLAFARSLLLGAEILLLDEPFAAVDPDSRRELRDLLDELRPATLQFLVLHDPLDVLASAAPILQVGDGAIREQSGDEYRRARERQFDVVRAR